MFKKISFLFFIVSFSFLAFTQEEEIDLLEEDVESVEGHHIEQLQKTEIKSITDLVHLIPFSDISVIQRRFMPKTGRVSISSSAVFILSSEFFLNPGVEVHLSYHILEKHSLELSGYYTFATPRKVTVDLQSLGVSVGLGTTVSIPTGFVGLSYKWMPIYGKTAFFNKKVLSFDTFFSLGGGASLMTHVWEPTALLGVGQVFAITRNFGLRWDLRLHLPVETKNNFNIQSHGILTLGFIYYYPSVEEK